MQLDSTEKLNRAVVGIISASACVAALGAPAGKAQMIFSALVMAAGVAVSLDGLERAVFRRRLAHENCPYCSKQYRRLLMQGIAGIAIAGAGVWGFSRGLDRMCQAPSMTESVQISRQPSLPQKALFTTRERSR